MKRLILSLIMISGALAIFCSSKTGNPNMENIDTFLRQQVVKQHTPSVYYVFFDSDSVVYQSTFGFGNVKEGKTVSDDNTYNIFSITKTFTAIAVLQLSEQGKIQLDEKIINYLPGFPYGNEVTVEHLLTHTAGLPNPLPLKWIHLPEEDKAFNRNEFFDRIFKEHKKLKSKPGSKFSYSNLGYVILGRLIEKVSGKTYEDYIVENVIKPLNLGQNELGFNFSTSFHVKGYQKRLSLTNLLLAVFLDKKKYMEKPEGKWKPFRPFYINGTSYGGMISTSGALVKYGQALLNKHCTLINEQSKKLLFSETNIGGEKTGMCYSWFKGSLKGNTYYHHAGGGGGYYTELRLYPGLGVGSVIFFNRTGMRDEKILDKTDAFFITANSQ